MDINTPLQLDFAETAEGFNHNISMETKGPFHPVSKGNCFFVVCDAFRHFFVTEPTPVDGAEPAADILLQQRITFLALQKY